MRQQQSVSPDVEELDQEVDRLTAKVGDLDLEKQNLADELALTRAELEEVRSQKTDASNLNLAEPAELLNQFRKKLPKSKISLREVETILEML